MEGELSLSVKRTPLSKKKNKSSLAKSKKTKSPKLKDVSAPPASVPPKLKASFETSDLLQEIEHCADIAEEDSNL